MATSCVLVFIAQVNESSGIATGTSTLVLLGLVTAKAVPKMELNRI